MAKKLSSVLGIDIGSRKIKIAEIKTMNKEPAVAAIGMIDTPEGAVDHTGVYNSEAVGIALKQALSQAGASVSHAVVSIAGQASVLVRTLEVPRMNATELKEHMQWEINRNIPFSESNVVSDYKPLADEDPDAQNMEVVMAIAPQSAIDTLVACVKKAGRQMAAIDVQPLSLARSLMTSYPDEFEHQTICLVDIGHKTTSINIYRDGRLLMPRQVPVGGEMFTKSISDAMGIGMEEAETLKQTKTDLSITPAPTAGSFDGFDLGGGGGGGGAGMTQEFTPYNPFADDPMGGMGTTPVGNPMDPNPMDPNPMEPNPMNPNPMEPIGMEPSPVDYHQSLPPTPDFGDPNPMAMLPEDPLTYDDPDNAYPAVTAAPILATPSATTDPDTIAIGNAIAPITEEFVAEIRRSVDYFRSRGGNVDRIVICGGGAKLHGLAVYLSAAVGIACDAYDPLRRLNIAAKKVEAGFVDEHRQEFAVAVGNGLHIFYD